MVIITGLGRCGTSILTKYLKEVGFSIGKNINWHQQVRAGYELSSFYILVDDFYHRYCKLNLSINLEDECLGNYWKGYTYREALENVDKDERQGDVIDVIKDPRITWHPDIIKAIWKVRPDLKLIICHRKVENIYKSRKSLPIQYDDLKRKILDEYKIDFSDFFTKVLELNIPYKLLFFPHFLKYFNMTYEKLNEWLPHDYDKGKEVWNRIIDKELLK